MRTRYVGEVSIIVCCIMLSNVLTACTPPRTGPQKTAQAVMLSAEQALEGKEALAGLGIVGAQALDEAMPSLVAIDQVLAGSKGAWMFFDACGKIAVFVSNAGKSASGAYYYFVGWVDVARGQLIDGGEVLSAYGIDFGRIKTFEDLETTLRQRGFVRLTPAAMPTLAATLKAALSFVKSIGSITLFVAPGEMLTPEMLNPYCLDGSMNCVPGIDS